VQVVVLGSAEKRIAFMVDEVLHEQEVLVKPLGRQLSRVRNIMGATVLGNGKVVPVLNVLDLLKTAVKKAPQFTAGLAEEPAKTSSVLVVEDSITARTLLRIFWKQPVTMSRQRLTVSMRSPHSRPESSISWFPMWKCPG